MIYLILILSLILRIISLDQSFWLDEAITATIARDLTVPEIFSQYLPLDNHPPFYLLLINLLFSFLPNTEFVARIPSVIFGLLTIYIIYLFTKQLIGQKAALLCSLLLATSPLHIYYSQEARMYSLNTLLVVLIMWIFIKYLKTGYDKFLFFYIGLSIILIYTDYLPYFIFLVTNLVIVILRRVNRPWILSQLILLVSFLPLLPIFTKQFFLGVGAIGVSDLFDLILGKFSYKTIPITLEKFVLGRIPIPEDTSIILIIIPVLIFTAICAVGILKSSKYEKTILNTWLFLPLALGLIFSLFIPIFQYFRFLFVLPAFYTLITKGIFEIQRKFAVVMVAVIVSINVFSTLIYLVNPHLQREQWKQTASWVARNVQEGKVLFASSDPFAPYIWYRKDHPEALGAFSGFYVKESDKYRVSQLARNRNRLLVFNYLQDITDPQKKLQTWILENEFKKTAANSFIGVGEIEVYER